MTIKTLRKHSTLNKNVTQRKQKSLSAIKKIIAQAEIVAGIDEAGICPIAGPVVAAAVILNPKQKVYQLRDSKIISEKKRNSLYKKIIDRALAYSIDIASVEEIDLLNIYHANMLAMSRAVAGLSLTPTLILIDGKGKPKIAAPPILTIVGGDRLIKSISAASIIAKVTRDNIMTEYHSQFPKYRFDKHKGYSTKEHQQNLIDYGPTIIHRRSFNTVKKYTQ